jgi:hypothetical protein
VSCPAALRARLAGTGRTSLALLAATGLTTACTTLRARLAAAAPILLGFLAAGLTIAVRTSFAFLAVDLATASTLRARLAGVARTSLAFAAGPFATIGLKEADWKNAQGDQEKEILFHEFDLAEE